MILAVRIGPALAETLTVATFEATVTVAHDSLEVADTAPVVVTVIAFPVVSASYSKTREAGATGRACAM